jgi:hypothetical protein
MDPLMPRKPQDVDRWSDEAEHDPAADPATGPQDRWVNEAARSDPEYAVHDSGEGGTTLLGDRDVVDDGSIAIDPTIAPE